MNAFWCCCMLCGLVQVQQPVGVNLDGGDAGSWHEVLQRCDLSHMRILISRDMPPDVLRMAPHLMWIGRPEEPHPDMCHAGAQPAPDKAVCLQKLTVLDLLVSAL